MSGLILPAGIKNVDAEIGAVTYWPVWNPRAAMDAVKEPAAGLLESASFIGNQTPPFGARGKDWPHFAYAGVGPVAPCSRTACSPRSATMSS